MVLVDGLEMEGTGLRTDRDLVCYTVQPGDLIDDLLLNEGPIHIERNQPVR